MGQGIISWQQERSPLPCEGKYLYERWKRRTQNSQVSKDESFTFYTVCDKYFKVEDPKTCYHINLTVYQGEISKGYSLGKNDSSVGESWSLIEHDVSPICRFVSWLNRSKFILWKIQSSQECFLPSPPPSHKMYAWKVACHKFQNLTAWNI